jgi:hypothetical protein
VHILNSSEAAPLPATTPVLFTSRVRGIGRDKIDHGGRWYDQVAARPDGSPCLNALQEAFHSPRGLAEGSTDLTAAWGGRVIGVQRFGPGLQLFPLTPWVIERCLARLALSVAVGA